MLGVFHLFLRAGARNGCFSPGFVKKYPSRNHKLSETGYGVPGCSHFLGAPVFQGATLDSSFGSCGIDRPLVGLDPAPRDTASGDMDPGLVLPRVLWPLALTPETHTNYGCRAHPDFPGARSSKSRASGDRPPDSLSPTSPLARPGDRSSDPKPRETDAAASRLLSFELGIKPCKKNPGLDGRSVAEEL